MSTPGERTRRTRIRRAYVILALLSVVLSAGSLTWSARIARDQAAQVRQQQETTRDGLCLLLVAATPPHLPRLPRPSASAGPTAREAYAFQQLYIRVKREYSCTS